MRFPIFIASKNLAYQPIYLYIYVSIRIRSFSGLFFPAFRLNTEIYFVNLRIQSKYGKNTDQKNSKYTHFLRSETYAKYVSVLQWGSISSSLANRNTTDLTVMQMHLIARSTLTSCWQYLTYGVLSPICKCSPGLQNNNAQKNFVSTLVYWFWTGTCIPCSQIINIFHSYISYVTP